MWVWTRSAAFKSCVRGTTRPNGPHFRCVMRHALCVIRHSSSRDLGSSFWFQHEPSPHTLATARPQAPANVRSPQSRIPPTDARTNRTYTDTDDCGGGPRCDRSEGGRSRAGGGGERELECTLSTGCVVHERCEPLERRERWQWCQRCYPRYQQRRWPTQRQRHERRWRCQRWQRERRPRRGWQRELVFARPAGAAAAGHSRGVAGGYFSVACLETRWFREHRALVRSFRWLAPRSNYQILAQSSALLTTTHHALAVVGGGGHRAGEGDQGEAGGADPRVRDAGGL